MKYKFVDDRTGKVAKGTAKEILHSIIEYMTDEQAQSTLEATFSEALGKVQNHE